MNMGRFEAMNQKEMMEVNGGGNFEGPMVKLLHYNYHTPYTRTVNRRGRTTVKYSGAPMGGNCRVCKYNAY